jgi:hypothetical protein
MANLTAIGKMYLSPSKVLESKAYYKTPALTCPIMAWRAIAL